MAQTIADCTVFSHLPSPSHAAGQLALPAADHVSGHFGSIGLYSCNIWSRTPGYLLLIIALCKSILGRLYVGVWNFICLHRAYMVEDTYGLSMRACAYESIRPVNTIFHKLLGKISPNLFNLVHLGTKLTY